MGGRWRQPTSRWVGLAVAGAYVVITAITGTALLVAGQQISAADAHAGPPVREFAQYTDTKTVTKDPSTLPKTHTPTTAKTTPPPTTTVTTTRPPATHRRPATKPKQPASGYARVTGPGGISTVAPAGWATARSTGPGAEIAVDPDNALRYVKFGGSATPNNDILAVHLMYEANYAARTPNYHRITLTEATFHDTDALVWEFEFSGPGGTQHAKSLYWRLRGTEYFVLASGPEGDWSRMSAIYNQMVANAKP